MQFDTLKIRIKKRGLKKIIETLRTKKLLSKSQMTEEQALQLDEELKKEWWQKIKPAF